MDTFTLPENFNPGGIKDREDPRDFQWSEIGFSMVPFNWQKGFDVEPDVATAVSTPGFRLPNKDQFSSYSCGGQAWANYGGALEAIFTKSFEERSAKFIYSQTYVQGGGSAGRDNSNVAVKQGWGKESLTPSYLNGSTDESFMERPSDITDAARQDAKSARALSYASVALDIDSLAQAIESNHGAVIGLTGANNGTWTSTVPVAPIAGQTLWNHWVYAGKAKMLGGKKAIGIFNSWGASVGDNGWQWITEDYFKGLSGSSIWGGWTHIYNTNSVPTSFQHNFQIDLVLTMNSPEVMALQHALQITGDFPASVNPTTYYGNVTANAVYKFQVRNGIAPADRNHCGPRTRAALNALFNK